MKRVAALLMLCLLVLVTASCGEDKKAQVEDRSGSSSIEETDEPTDEPSGDASDDASEEPDDDEGSDDEGSDEPASLGDVVRIGDWSVKVTKVELNGNAAIRSANQFNDRPDGQYVLVTYAATYNGDERSADATSDLSWSFTTTDAQVNDEASQVTPADTDEWPTEARKGGTVRGQVVFDLPASKIRGGLLTVEGYDDELDTVYADFKVK